MYQNVPTYEKLFESVSNINREPEDGCMKKVRLERSLKLRKEDKRSIGNDIISNVQMNEQKWIDSYGHQK